MTSSTQVFVRRILMCEGYSVKQVAWHETGHAFIWRGAFPDIETRYSIIDGNPSVSVMSGSHELDINAMTKEEASKYTYIRLGGLSAEMILLGISGNAREVAKFVADDYFSTNPIMDWDDDKDNGGDVPVAFKIISSKVNARSVKDVFVEIFASCVSNISNNIEIFRKEAHDTERKFELWRKLGRWVL